MQAIRTASLTKYYGRARGIEKLDLTVEEGEFFGFIGPNGAGKSTTIRTLLGLIRPTSGSASVLGLDIEKDRQRILSQVGYLPAEAAFYPGMRVGEVLRLSACGAGTAVGRRRSCAAACSWTFPARWRSCPWATGKRRPSSAPCSTSPGC